MPSKRNIFTRNAYLDVDSEASAEERLYQAVIIRAILDSTIESKKSSERIAREQAQEFLKGETDDFCEVCARAGWHPDYVRRKYHSYCKREERISGRRCPVNQPNRPNGSKTNAAFC